MTPPIEFKKNYLTSEFLTSAPLLLVAGSMRNDLVVCLILASYILSRGLFKKNRTTLIGNGFFTSEYGAYILGMGYFLWRIHTGIPCLLFMAVVQVAYNLSRGHTKSLTPAGKVYNLG